MIDEFALPPSKSRIATRIDERGNQSSGSAAKWADGARFATGAMLTERYRIIRLLGRGGMGEVYRAFDPKIGSEAATQSIQYDVSADGLRFLFISRMAEATSSVAVVLNWIADLKK